MARPPHSFPKRRSADFEGFLRIHAARGAQAHLPHLRRVFSVPPTPNLDPNPESQISESETRNPKPENHAGNRMMCRRTSTRLRATYLSTLSSKIRSLKPENRTPKPETQISKPDTRNLKPRSRNTKPEDPDPQRRPYEVYADQYLATGNFVVHPHLRNPKPGTRNPTPETPKTRNPDLETRHTAPETRNSDLETRNSKSETREPET